MEKCSKRTSKPLRNPVKWMSDCDKSTVEELNDVIITMVFFVFAVLFFFSNLQPDELMGPLLASI